MVFIVYLSNILVTASNELLLFVVFIFIIVISTYFYVICN